MFSGNSRADGALATGATERVVRLFRATLLLIHRVRIKHLVRDHLPVVFPFLVLPEKATVISLVAGSADLLDFDKKRIAVAIGNDGLDQFEVAAALPL